MPFRLNTTTAKDGQPKDWQMLLECINLSRYHNVKYSCDYNLPFINSTKKGRKRKGPNSPVHKRIGT